MFFHKHPYVPFIQKDTKKLIVGTLPPPRFSTGDLLEKDVNFCYGSYYNSLWLFIDKIHNLNLRYDNSQEAIDDYNLKLELVNAEVPRIHKFSLPSVIEREAKQSVESDSNQYRTIKTVSLTSGSGAANISISRMPLYKQLKAKDPNFNTFDFRVMQYSEFF